MPERWHVPLADVQKLPSRLFYKDAAGSEGDLGAAYPTKFQESNGNQIIVRYAPGVGLPSFWTNSSARIDEIEDVNKLANAASERRKARVRQRKTREFVWEPQDESSNYLVLILAVLVAVFAAVVVFLTVFLK